MFVLDVYGCFLGSPLKKNTKPASQRNNETCQNMFFFFPNGGRKQLWITMAGWSGPQIIGIINEKTNNSRFVMMCLKKDTNAIAMILPHEIGMEIYVYIYNAIPQYPSKFGTPQNARPLMFSPKGRCLRT